MIFPRSGDLADLGHRLNSTFVSDDVEDNLKIKLIAMVHMLCQSCIFQCLLLSSAYVGSFYLWGKTGPRDDPLVVKRRIISALLVAFSAPFFMYSFIHRDNLVEHGILELIGVKLPGVLIASTVPLALTMILFLGPLAIQFQSDQWALYSEPRFWFENIKSIFWLRDFIIAPLSEELTFRACMLPLLVQCFRPQSAVFVCPLFFGIAHLHHIFERLKSGYTLKAALLIAAFQFMYTTMFGAYSAFLFLRTGHLMAPFLAHVFCNLMGFPNFTEILYFKEPKRSISFILCVSGLVSWCFLLVPLTNPHWYQNSVYWR